MKSLFSGLLILALIAPPVFCEETERVLEDFNGKVRTFSEHEGDISFQGASGLRFGAWSKDPGDQTQTCQVVLSDDALGEGRSARIFYDVDSPHPAFNGFYLKLDGADFSSFDTLNLYLKGDAKQGFTPRLKIELKNSHQAHLQQKEVLGLDQEPFLGTFTFPFLLEGITDQWQKFSVPFESFPRFHDWTDMHELVIVFDDIHSGPRAGVIYLDRISVSKKTDPKTS